MAGEKLVEMMKQAGRNGIPATERTDIVYGTVQTTHPLLITLDKDPKMRLTETFLYLSPLCKRKTVTIPAWQTTAAGEEPHSHTIEKHTVEIWRGLRSGDHVLMLRCSNGGMYYVLQREGEL